MRDYMPKVGSLGLDMMTRTCTVQVNLDFERRSGHGEEIPRLARAAADRDRAVRRLAVHRRQAERLSVAIARISGPTPIADRTGMLDFVFDDGFGFERYVDYLLDVPMYFSYRDGKYIDLAGKSFKDFLAGKLERTARRTADAERLGRSHDHRISGSAPEEISRNARRRWRPLEPSVRIAGVLGRTVVRHRIALDAAWDLVKDFIDGRTPRTARRRAETRAETSVPRRHRSRPRHRSAEDRRQRLGTPQSSKRRPARAKPSSSNR